MLRIFAQRWACFYFTLGRGKPQQEIANLYFTHCGEILGRVTVQEIVCNVGQLPKLRSLENRVSEWQIKRDRWVAICPGPFVRLQGETVYHDSFRGWHYFDLTEYVKTPASIMPV